MAELNIAFGRFTLKALLGKGSFGEVYKAYDPKLGQDVALKVLHQGLMADLSFINKARKEANLVQQIQHPNVVKIYELGDADGRAYIEMEFVDGQSLAGILKSGKRFNIAQVVSFIEQISSALDATHAKKIVHRDVKPANVLIDKAGIVHLVDFGLAHAAKSSLGSSSTTAGIGTAMYMSPEQAKGQTGDKATDIYSLGIVAFELLTGRLPFEAENLPGYIAAHLNQKPPDPKKFNPAITKPVRDVLYKALSKSPAGRYKSASDFARALHSASEKSDAGRGGCLVMAFVSIVIVVLIGVGLMAGPFSEQAQQMVAEIMPGNPFVTDIPNYMPTRTPDINNTPVSALPTLTNLPPAVLESGSTEQVVVTATLAPAPTKTSVVVANPAPAAGGELPVLVGTGIQITTGSGQGTGILVRLLNGVGESVESGYFSVYTQKQDLAGKWVVDKRVKTGNTDNSGQIFFDLLPGDYIVSSDFYGYNWGDAAGVNGQANLNVQPGKVTQLTLALGRLTIGFLRGDGSVITDQYVMVYRQKKDLAGNWVVDQRVVTGNTDNSGLRIFDLTPGYYIVASDLAGYNWGTAADVKGMASVLIQSGLETRLIISLGQLQVGLKDSNGNPRPDQYIQVYTQKKDVSGASALGDRVAAGHTDNTGVFMANLAPGQYAIRIDEQVLFDVEVATGRITFADGARWEFTR